jgi:Tfp pilus assembly protein PilX
MIMTGATRDRQAGMALFLVLVLLVVITMFAVAAFNSGTTNLRIAGNAMARNEALLATQSIIETIISDNTFTTDPAGIAAIAYPVDIDGSGTSSYTVNLTPAPACYRSKIVKTATLDPAVKADLACMSSSGVNKGGIDSANMAAGAGDSLCAETEWTIRATSTDARTGASVAINQGIGVRVLSTDADALCTG